MRWFSIGYFGYADMLSGLLIGQAKLQLEASSAPPDSVLEHVRKKLVGNQGKTFFFYVENDITIQYHYYLLTLPVVKDMNKTTRPKEVLKGATTLKGGYSWIRF